MLLVAVCTILLAAGQVLMKSAVNANSTSSVFLSPWLILGVLSYMVGGIFLVVAFKFGDLSVLYPIIALGFVWVTAASMFFLGEQISLQQYLGTAVIIVGVSLVGYGGRK